MAGEASYNPYSAAKALVDKAKPQGYVEFVEYELRLAQVHALLAIAQQLSYIHQRMVDDRGRR